MHFYKLFELKSVLAVCVHNHPIMIRIHPVFYFESTLNLYPFLRRAVRFQNVWNRVPILIPRIDSSVILDSCCFFCKKFSNLISPWWHDTFYINVEYHIHMINFIHFYSSDWDVKLAIAHCSAGTCIYCMNWTRHELSKINVHSSASFLWLYALHKIKLLHWNKITITLTITITPIELVVYLLIRCALGHWSMLVTFSFRITKNCILDGNKIKTLDHVMMYSLVQRSKLWTAKASSTVK